MDLVKKINSGEILNFDEAKSSVIMKAVKSLRENNIKSEFYPDLGTSNKQQKRQWKYVSSREIEFVVSKLENGIFTLKDMTSILEETRFTIPYIEFGGMQYLDIIKRIILSAGFQNQFSFQETSEDPLFSEYTLALRNQVSYGQYSVPDAGNFSARSDEFILPKINNILNQCLNYRGLPSFVWNPELRYFQLTWRYEPSFGDVLYFIGERETFGVDFSAGSEGDSRFPKNWHGVLSSNYTITSKISSLAAGLEMYGQAFDSTVIGRNEFYDGSVTATDTALTELGIQRLNDCVDDRTIVPSKIGYVGYRKFHLFRDKLGFLQDYTGLNIYFKQVKRIIRNTKKHKHTQKQKTYT